MVGNKGYKALGSPSCIQTNTNLRAYGNGQLSVKSECSVTVTIGQTTKQNLRLLVVASDDGTNLLGLDWSDIFGLSQRGLTAVANNTIEINAIKPVDSQVSVLTERYADVFKQGIGHCKSFKVPIHLQFDTKPFFQTTRNSVLAI